MTSTLTKTEFLRLMTLAYDLPAHAGTNLDALDEALEEKRETLDSMPKLSLRPFFATLLADRPAEERNSILELLNAHFKL